MEESQGILLKSLANSGVTIPTGVSSISDLTPATLVSICGQSLHLIDPASKFPTSLPDSTADRFKICTDLASAVTSLGFIGEFDFHKFLYPSEDDMYKLVRFLLKKLSEIAEDVEAAVDNSGGITSTSTKEEVIKYTSLEERDENTDNHMEVIHVGGDKTRLKDLALNAERPDSLNTISIDASVSGSRKNHVLPRQVDEIAVPITSRSDMQSNGSDDLEDDKMSAEKLGKFRVDASRDEESRSQLDDGHILEIRQKDISLQTPEIYRKIEDLRRQEKLLMEEASTRTLEAQHLEEEYLNLKSAVEMASDDQNTSDFYVLQLNEQLEARRGDLLQLKTQWDTTRQSLESKKDSLEEATHATKPEALIKLKRLKEIEMEIGAVISEIEKREKEHSKLLADLKVQPKGASRRSYIERVTEITKNSRKLDADIDRILKDTRELQLESNFIQERLQRTYAVVDEMVFREAKKDQVGQQAYRLLAGIHESFEQISDRILTTDRIRREVAEYEAKLSSLARRSFNVDKLQADLQAIKRENEFLEQRLQNS